MKEAEMAKVAEFIDRSLKEIDKYQVPETKEERIEYIKNAKQELNANTNLLKIREEVKELCVKFPVPGIE
jgi:glycine/serine hydroxymethyltransferase